MASTQKTTQKVPSLDPRFTSLVQLLAEVRLRIIREAAAQQQGKRP
jgi:hypothetical protein